MTGFGRARGPVGSDRAGEVVIRSVNSRFLDLTIKTKESEAALEPALRRTVGGLLHRGKVEVALRLKRTTPVEQEISVDEGLLQALLARITALSAKYPIEGKLSVRDILTIPQVVVVDAPTDSFSPEEIAAVEGLAREAASALVAMRATEGGSIVADLSPRIAFLRQKAAGLSARREEIARNLAATLKLDGVMKGFVDRNRQRAPACRANSHALSASGRIISALAGANSLVAVPSRTRPMMPCKMAAMRKKL